MKYSRDTFQQAERVKLRKLVEDIMERREYSGCWFSNDGDGDCGNWPGCCSDCPLKQLMDYVGIVPQEDGGMDKQPAAVRAAQEKEARVVGVWLCPICHKATPSGETHTGCAAQGEQP